MATVKMMQGDSYPVFADLKVSGNVLKPSMVAEIEVTAGDAIRKTYTSGEMQFDTSTLEWFFIPSQEETLAMEPGGYDVQARIKFPNGDYSSVVGVTIGRIVILDAQSEEVI